MHDRSHTNGSRSTRTRGTHLNGLASSIEGSATMGAANQRCSHPHPIDLAVGEPAAQPSPVVVEAAVRALRSGQIRYGPPAGLPELRELVADDQTRKSGFRRSADEVLITAGGKVGVLHALNCLIEHGDEVLVLAPYWPSFLQQVTWAGGRPVIVPPGAGLLPDLEAIEAACTERTRVLILNDPNNPTSLSLDAERLREIARLAERRGLWILADQVYDDLVLEGDHAPLLRVAPEIHLRTVVVESFSKRFAMTGYRLGSVCAPAPVIEAMTRLTAASTTCANAIAQHAGIAALRDDDLWIELQRAGYMRRRDTLVQRITTMESLSLEHVPETGFYLFLELQADWDDVELVKQLRHREGLLLVPGSAFGVPGHLRLSYTASDAALHEACNRMERLFDQLWAGREAAGRENGQAHRAGFV